MTGYRCHMDWRPAGAGRPLRSMPMVNVPGVRSLCVIPFVTSGLTPLCFPVGVQRLFSWNAAF